MRKKNLEIAPEEIRAVREGLGLTQVEAGELLGGGPRAFTKYEAGTVRPAAAVVNLLRLLEADPAALATLGGRKPHPMAAAGVRPFEVTGEHVAALTERTLPQLLRYLLSAEAQAHGLPAAGIHVATSIHTADGGEDGRIEWTGGPDYTPFLPSRLCQFQSKAGSIGPKAAGRAVLTKGGAVKDRVRSAVEAGGSYIMLCGHSYVQDQIEDREHPIREALRGTGLTIDDRQVGFRDADQIADWVNHHPSVATWLKERTQPGTIGPFRSWGHWAGRAEHDGSPWVAFDDGTFRTRYIKLYDDPGTGGSLCIVSKLPDGQEVLINYIPMSDLSEGDSGARIDVQRAGSLPFRRGERRG